MTCMPSPESPANRITTWSIDSTLPGSLSVLELVVTAPPLGLPACVPPLWTIRSLTCLPVVMRHCTGRRTCVPDGDTVGRPCGPDWPCRVRRASSAHMGAWTAGASSRSGDGDGVVEVDVLDGMDDADSLVEWALERLAAHDEARAARPAC